MKKGIALLQCLTTSIMLSRVSAHLKKAISV